MNSEIENLKKEKEEMNKRMIVFDNREQELKVLYSFSFYGSFYRICNHKLLKKIKV